MASFMQGELVSIGPAVGGIEGMLTFPDSPAGIVLFAHGSDSGRLSPRNNYVANVLQRAGIGTLLVDLLTSQEDRSYQMRFDIGLLSQRLNMAVEWLLDDGRTRELPLGLFGASTGAAAALQVAAMRESEIAAVVCRGGRPDLAGRMALMEVQAPTLLIVGGLDNVVIDLNRDAFDLLRCEKRIEIVPGASHLFEETGKLEAVAGLTADWFAHHLRPGIPYENKPGERHEAGKRMEP